VLEATEIAQLRGEVPLREVSLASRGLTDDFGTVFSQSLEGNTVLQRLEYVYAYTDDSNCTSLALAAYHSTTWQTKARSTSALFSRATSR
jgi:hypothetical protein